LLKTTVKVLTSAPGGRVGLGVAVGVGVRVGLGVRVGVGGMGVAVGGGDVGVGGRGVTVGGMGVAVGGMGVAVGGGDVGTLVAVGDGSDPQPLAATKRTTAQKNSAKRLITFDLLVP
jgi:hypothetical protein